MPESIDYKFLSQLEGGSKTIGYVPAANVSKSGVTIATGFDLGQRNEADLKALGLSATLIAKLKPYLGKKANDAQKVLKKSPLAITSAQAEEINKAVKKKHIEQIQQKYNAAVGNKKKFSDVPPQAQTVIASVSFQYGINLNARTPEFWEAVTAQDWDKVKELLEKFGDAYPTRRKKEAALIGEIK